VTSVLTSISLLNSLESSWMTQRIAALKDPNSAYLVSQIGPVPPTLQQYQQNSLEKYARAEQEFEKSGRKSVAPQKEEYLAAALRDHELDSQLYTDRYTQIYAAFSRCLFETKLLL